MPEVAIADVPEQARYVLELDGAPAGLIDYRLAGGRISLMHAEVDPPMRERGLASEMVGFALDDARARGLEVLPYCPFVRGYIAAHDQYLDLVPEHERARFGL
jgi:uncharacterized protein